MKHTPGPWRTGAPNVFDDEFPENIGIVSDDEWTVADVQSDVAEFKDNARLIATAPELLEAARELYFSSRNEPVGRDGDYCWLVDGGKLQNLFAAIRKAEGAA